MWTAAPWLFLLWLGEAIACRRWTGWSLLVSLALSTTAVLCGWRVVCRWGERQHDLAGARLLAAVPDPEPWARFVHPVQRLKARHLSRCYRRWGVSPRSSGWQFMERAARLELASIPFCVVLAVHPWWFHL